MTPIASLVLWGSGPFRGPETPYLDGYSFPTDPNYNYEPVVAGIGQVATHDVWAPGPPIVIHSWGKPIQPPTCCVVVPPPQQPDTPEPVVPEPHQALLIVATLIVGILVRRWA